MRSRRLACVLLGLWLGAGLLMGWARIETARSVDRILARPTPGLLLGLKALDAQQATALMRHLAAEQNRFWLESWETVQLMLGIFFFLFLLFGTRQGKVSLGLALLMLIIVAGQRFFLTPEIIGRGRMLDFADALARRDRVQLAVLDYAYLLTDIAKYSVGLILAAVLVWPHGKSLDAGDKVHVVDKADHRHINR